MVISISQKVIHFNLIFHTTGIKKVIHTSYFSKLPIYGVIALCVNLFVCFCNPTGSYDSILWFGFSESYILN